MELCEIISVTRRRFAKNTLFTHHKFTSLFYSLILCLFSTVFQLQYLKCRIKALHTKQIDSISIFNILIQYFLQSRIFIEFLKD